MEELGKKGEFEVPQRLARAGTHTSTYDFKAQEEVVLKDPRSLEISSRVRMNYRWVCPVNGRTKK